MFYSKRTTTVLLWTLLGVVVIGAGLFGYALMTGRISMKADTTTGTKTWYPIADSGTANLMGSDGNKTNNFEMIDEASANDDTDYLKYQLGTPATIFYDYYQPTNDPVPAGSKNISVNLYVRGKNFGNPRGADTSYIGGIKSGTKLEKAISVTDHNNAWVNNVKKITIDPATSQPWTPDGVNAILFVAGLEARAMNFSHITSMRADVTYTMPAAAGQIIGTVKDQFGNAKAGVTVNLAPANNTNGYAATSTTADASGSYKFSGIPPDSQGFSTYSLTVDQIKKSTSTPPFCTTAPSNVSVTVPNSQTVTADIAVPLGYLFSLDVNNETYLGRSAILATWDAISYRNFLPNPPPDVENEYPYLATINSLQAKNNVCIATSVTFLSEPYYWTVDNDTDKTNKYSSRIPADILNSAALTFNATQYYYLSQVPKQSISYMMIIQTPQQIKAVELVCQ